jgi:hypothetical protein
MASEWAHEVHFPFEFKCEASAIKRRSGADVSQKLLEIKPDESARLPAGSLAAESSRHRMALESAQEARRGLHQKAKLTSKTTGDRIPKLAEGKQRAFR